MQAVRAPRPLIRTGRSTLAALACAVLLAACGGSDDEGGGGRAERPAGLPRDFNLQLFRCADWERANEPTRRYVLRRLKEVTSGQVSGTGVRGRGTVLPDEQARHLFDSYCPQPYAQGFVLYKLYGQAAGFVGGRP